MICYLFRCLLLGLLLSLAALTPFHAAWAQQGRARTEARLGELRSLIQQDEVRLSKTLTEEETLPEKKENLDRQITLRQELVETYRHQLSRLALERDSLRQSLDGMDEEFEALKLQYRRRARHAYKHGRLHDLALILSARSINQMLIRARYLSRFAGQRRSKLYAIKETSATLEARRLRLQTSAARTQSLLEESRREQQNLKKLQEDREDVIRTLRSQRSDLEQTLKRRRTAADAFEAQIRASITQETARRRPKARRLAVPSAAYAHLAGSFLQHQGKLPWPTEGVVQEPFGNVVNPIHNTVTSNPGILIATSPSAEVRAIFEGEVTDVDVMPGYGTFLTISHGTHQSVYSNFSLLYVSRGDRVSTGQALGRSGTDSEPKGATLFFALFEGGNAVNPLPWLQSR
ncbi:MAG: murein hydrolase activator EnvC family protein [Rhodothermales bacterium]